MIHLSKDWVGTRVKDRVIFLVLVVIRLLRVVLGLNIEWQALDEDEG